MRRAVAADIGPAADVLASAFHDSPWTRWTVDAVDHVQRIRALQHLSLRTMSLPFGQVWLAEVDGVVESVAAWMDSAIEVPAAVLAEVAPMVAALEGDRHAASVDAELGAAKRPVGRHLYLGVLGTSPSHQGQGLASRVLQPVFDQADASRVECFLETSLPANVEFYQRLGFESVDHHLVAEGGPHAWAMVRQPR